MKSFILCTLIFVAVTTLPCSAQFDDASWMFLTDDDTPDALSLQALAPTSDGFYVTYMKSLYPSTGHSIFVNYTDNISGWQGETLVFNQFPAYSPSIATRISEPQKIVIFFDSMDDIYGGVIENPGDSWEFQNYTESAGMDIQPSVAIDDNGDIHLGWVKAVERVYKIAYGKIVDDSIEIDIIDESELGGFAIGAMSSITTNNNLPHLLYRGQSDGLYHIYHAYKNDPEDDWQIELVITENLEDYNAACAVDMDNNIHVAISGNNGSGSDGQIFYTYRDYDTGEWSPAELVTGEQSASQGSIAITDEGTIYIASVGLDGIFFSGDLFIANNSSGEFISQLIIHWPNGTSPTIAFQNGIIGGLVMQGEIGSPGYENMEILFYGTVTTGIDDQKRLPNEFYAQNYPNPFNASTVIRYNLPEPSAVTIDIYDILGRKVTTLIDRQQPVGYHQAIWDADELSSGVYFYKIKAGDYIETKKMVLLK